MRLHLIEIAEQPWCPAPVRDGVTDYLQLAIALGKAYAPAEPLLADALRRARAHDVVDLASGAGGPWAALAPALAGRGARVDVRLTDFQPNADALAHVAARTPGVSVERRPVDARRVPDDLRGFRTIFSALHHFRPADVRAILRDAADRGVGFAAFEATRRDARAVVVTLLAPLIVLLATPFIRPFRLSRVLFTYLVPLIPLVVLWDGIVSCLRTYTPAELRALAPALDDYDWTAGEAGTGPVPVTYLIGVPTSAG